MVFTNKEQLSVFLKSFDEKYPCYLNLVNEQLASNKLKKTDVGIEGVKITFLWYFVSREDYINFVNLIQHTRFATLLSKLGWKNVTFGSA